MAIELRYRDLKAWRRLHGNSVEAFLDGIESLAKIDVTCRFSDSVVA